MSTLWYEFSISVTALTAICKDSALGTQGQNKLKARVG